MSAAIVWGPIAIVVAVAMDAWAALLHRRVWHRGLWRVHRSHHRSGRGWEANDVLSLTHAPIAIALILFGCRGPAGPGREVAFGVGLGMSLFGVAYVLVHDGLVHGRLPVRGLLRVAWLRRVVDAHLVHHRGARGGPPYGLFSGPRELRRHARAPSAATASRVAQRDASPTDRPRPTRPHTAR